jgi:hypothetical protein
VKKITMLVAGAVALTSVATIQPANAGCLSGAAVGGVAGHVAGHHGLIGAGIGCWVGHHRAAMRHQDHYNRY